VKAETTQSAPIARIANDFLGWVWFRKLDIDFSLTIEMTDGLLGKLARFEKFQRRAHANLDQLGSKVNETNF